MLHLIIQVGKDVAQAIDGYISTHYALHNRPPEYIDVTQWQHDSLKRYLDDLFGRYTVNTTDQLPVGIVMMYHGIPVRILNSEV